MAKLETTFWTKITEIETVAQKNITELEANWNWNKRVTYWSYPDAVRLSSGDKVVPVTVRMSEYTKKKSEVSWYSDPFYAHHKGYKMCLCVDPDGYILKASGSHALINIPCLIAGSMWWSVEVATLGRLRSEAVTAIATIASYPIICSWHERTYCHLWGTYTLWSFFVALHWW